ncbi:glycosyl hydrolase family 18 protein [Neobacillus sp. NPDC093182]|uniref:glycosyl hydrolase family 18 protein n=1 Tax=Neobacillus sp. NPDC093182 TaxID=3364297 RepID=UPI00380B19D5
MELNQLQSSMIFVGQELKLPMVAGLETDVIAETEAFNMGYLYFGSSSDFVNTMNQTEGTINVVSPTYFNLNSDGSLQLTNQTDRYFIASMQKSDVRVVPFLSNHWDREVGNAALENREQLSQQIADSIALYNLDGINVDIENITHENREEFTDFVRLLREKVPEGKEVSVAVPANPTGSNLGWHGAYDYQQLAQHSDYLMIMAYDESYAGGPAGPIASIGFAEQSIQFALDHGVPKEKIVLGIGH